MKKFFLKLFLFGVLYMSIAGTFLVASANEKLGMPIAELTHSKEYIYEDFGPNEIMPYIARVQEKNQYTKLVLGDSVCNQIFERYHGTDSDLCICGTNQAVSMAGQYILAKEFVDNHENVTDIYLIIIMDSLASGFNAQLGYQYAVMPFVETDTIGALDEETRDEISHMYGGFFSKKKTVEIIHKSPLCMKLYLNALAKKDQMFPQKQQGLISDLSYRYLIKLQDLCDKEGIRFHLTPGPHADSENQHVRAEQVRREVEERGDQLDLETYFDQIIYYPEALFKDRVHFDEDQLKEVFFDELAKDLLSMAEADVKKGDHR